MAAIQHKAGDNCWCKEKHTNLEAMLLNSRDIPKSGKPSRWGAKKKTTAKTKKKRKGEY